MPLNNFSSDDDAEDEELDDEGEDRFDDSANELELLIIKIMVLGCSLYFVIVVDVDCKENATVVDDDGTESDEELKDVAGAASVSVRSDNDGDGVDDAVGFDRDDKEDDMRSVGDEGLLSAIPLERGGIFDDGSSFIFSNERQPPFFLFTSLWISLSSSCTFSPDECGVDSITRMSLLRLSSFFFSFLIKDKISLPSSLVAIVLIPFDSDVEGDENKNEEYLSSFFFLWVPSSSFFSFSF